MNIGKTIRDKMNVYVGLSIYQNLNNYSEIVVKLKYSLYRTLWGVVSFRTWRFKNNISDKYEYRKLN